MSCITRPGRHLGQAHEQQPRSRNELSYSILGCDGVVPVVMEQVSSEGYGFLLLVGKFDFGGVEGGVEFTSDG